MRTIRTFDQIIMDSVDFHVRLCEDKLSKGEKLMVIDLPTEFATKVFTRMYDETIAGGRLQDWKFGFYRHGECEGKMAMTVERSGVEYKRYFLNYTL